MDRPEVITDNHIYHVYNRGNRRQPIFEDQNDYRAFLQKIEQYRNRYHVSVIAYLFQGSYRFKLIDSSTSLLEVARYIHLNPVSAGLCLEPERWLHSSYRQLCGEADAVEEVILRTDSAPIVSAVNGHVAEYLLFVKSTLLTPE